MPVAPPRPDGVDAPVLSDAAGAAIPGPVLGTADEVVVAPEVGCVPVPCDVGTFDVAPVLSDAAGAAVPGPVPETVGGGVVAAPGVGCVPGPCDVGAFDAARTCILGECRDTGRECGTRRERRYLDLYNHPARIRALTA